MNDYPNPFQAILDSFSAQWRKERAETQMTLSKMIQALESMPINAKVPRLVRPMSYRGFYEDLAFEQGEGDMSVGDLLTMAQGAMGREFCGYKGGEFMMGESTPVWIAHYGCTGQRLMAIREGEIETAPYED